MEKSFENTPLTFSNFLGFYDQMIKPQLDTIDRVRENLSLMKHETNQRFDDLYKKFEKLDQEYIVICHQMKEVVSRYEALDAQYEKWKPFDVENISKQLTQLKSRIDVMLPLAKASEGQALIVSDLPEDPYTIAGWEFKRIKTKLSELEERIQSLEKRHSPPS